MSSVVGSGFLDGSVPMSHDVRHSEALDLTVDNAERSAVSFDPAGIVLKGRYFDELSAYRARKIWAETLEANFLLDRDHDFSLAIIHDSIRDLFELHCNFHTACARYAFWRLTNNQAPEAQYQIETAHIPVSERLQDAFMRAPDLQPEPTVLRGVLNEPLPARPNLLGWMRDIMSKVVRRS